jgi:4'-phosphopantetheinyl transferase
VHVWCVPLEAAAGSPADRRELARAVLRRVLADYLDAEPAAVPIARAAGGKPYVPGDPVHFNLSHSGGVALIAVADEPVGVDVEACGPTRDALAIARRFFTPEEAGALARLAPPERDRAFLRVWTRKEAILKARGLGLDALRDVVVAVEPGPSSAGGWRLLDVDAGPDAVASVAARGVERLTTRVRPPASS